ncbi:MAG: hypothetical protein HOK52_14655 [Candidatus Marinimicrobia bacterium]|mgnify:FL=1|jgi:hypothetical protein|nr:hypothetical protein [Candidatus Neomarinimicrobiota bacterium]
MKLPEINEVYNALKSSAKKRGIVFTLEKSDMYDLDYPLTCPALGIPLAFNKGQSQDNSYSWDRIDSSRGYEADNLVIISNRANRIKNDATLEELKLIVAFYENLIDSL